MLRRWSVLCHDGVLFGAEIASEIVDEQLSRVFRTVFEKYNAVFLDVAICLWMNKHKTSKAELQYVPVRAAVAKHKPRLRHTCSSLQ